MEPLCPTISTLGENETVVSECPVFPAIWDIAQKGQFFLTSSRVPTGLAPRLLSISIAKCLEKAESKAGGDLGIRAWNSTTSH